MEIHLVLHPAYSHSGKLRALLRQALLDKGLPTEWQEFRAGDSLESVPEVSDRSNAIVGNGKTLLEFGNQEVPDLKKLKAALGCQPGCSCSTAAEERSFQWKRAGTLAGSLLLSIGIAIFPKCPMCWAAWMSMLGVLGLESVPYSPWMQPLILVGLLINLYFIYKKARLTQRMLPFWLTCGGTAFVLLFSLLRTTTPLLYLGMLLLVSGSLLNLLSATHFQSLESWVKKRWLSGAKQASISPNSFKNVNP